MRRWGGPEEEIGFCLFVCLVRSSRLDDLFLSLGAFLVPLSHESRLTPVSATGFERQLIRVRKWDLKYARGRRVSPMISSNIESGTECFTISEVEIYSTIVKALFAIS